jgi:thiazole synthase|uniref:Thiazole synthase n=2 Tax=Cyanidioschyzon merolae TaxID=45157 RepID=THIG_CYAM1|nr:thiamin biosynthesis protein G [Cyanidioschyzon merolae strain 10D]Q85G31.1 RecName: Full=Thiazole synthase [Cyanidioschyzon merolae strain 10D]QFV17140.1 thiamine biosynthesis protein G [Cyanidioschyzon merolae]BAC76160.1 thiamine biosynthesis protein G [Cyanidioschyzon merolae strain 10D]
MDSFCLHHYQFSSRLILGTGRYSSPSLAQQSIEASGCEIVTVAVRRFHALHAFTPLINWNRYWLLPNTAGCRTCSEAVRVALLARQLLQHLQQPHQCLIKLEVIPDPLYLLPDPLGTLKAAEILVRKGFAVLPYIYPDPVLALQLEQIGCAAVMPLASPIGSGQGIQHVHSLQLILQNARIPVIIDAGLALPSDASRVMEMGASAVLINSAIALSPSPVSMAHAMKLAVQAGRLAFLAGRMPLSSSAHASSASFGSFL